MDNITPICFSLPLDNLGIFDVNCPIQSKVDVIMLNHTNARNYIDSKCIVNSGQHYLCKVPCRLFRVDKPRLHPAPGPGGSTAGGEKTATPMRREILWMSPINEHLGAS